ncbi:MAG: hypothetical protein PHI35_08260 [Victivallaceae bacterium]|nr:hypothetical protein [Victivallaceae bacterium]
MPICDDEVRRVTGDGFSAVMYAAGEISFELEIAGQVRMRQARTECGGFAGAMSLPQKLRCHALLDGFSVGLESETRLPFGCEYSTARSIELFNGGGSCTVDVRALNRGVVGDLALGDLEFPGPWNRLELYTGDAKPQIFALAEAENVLYCDEKPPLLLRLYAADGLAFEYAAGVDFWRLGAAGQIAGCHAEFAVKGSTSGVNFRRRVLKYDADAVQEKRPWRFKSVFGWSLAQATPPANAQEVPVAESAFRIDAGGQRSAAPCPVAASVQRQLRDAVRRTDKDIVIAVEPGLCFDAAHLERPAKKLLPHFDLENWLAFYLWGNRQLAKRGLALTLRDAGCGNFSGSPLLAAMSRPPRQIEK